MIAQHGIHRVAFFYAGIYVLAIIGAKLADVSNVMTQHELTLPDVLLRLGIGVTAGALLAGLWLVVTRTNAGLRRVDAVLADVVGPIDASDAVILALLSGLAEEVLFRGVIQTAGGLPLASLLFMLAHLPPQRDLWPWTWSAGAIGLLLGAITQATGDILVAVAVHATLNAINLHRLGLLAREREAAKKTGR